MLDSCWVSVAAVFDSVLDCVATKESERVCVRLREEEAVGSLFESVPSPDEDGVLLPPLSLADAENDKDTVLALRDFEAVSSEEAVLEVVGKPLSVEEAVLVLLAEYVGVG